MAEYRVRKLNDGLGYGHGTISAAELVELAGEDARTAGQAVINSPAILVAVDRDDTGKLVDDDGCGDGRGVEKVFQGWIVKHKSLNRAKVFGGGVAMTAATLIGLGVASRKPLNEVFSSALGTLTDKKINFGAHTADHVKPGREELDSGCGAIDGAPEVILASVAYGDAISDVITDLGLGSDHLDEVLDNFAACAQYAKTQPYRGKTIMNKIINQDKIVKQLRGEHVEFAIVLNTVRGYTVNQQAVRDATGGKLDVFAVDVWRMQDYAQKLYEDPLEQEKAFLSELVYTLATAGVLTKGDLTTYLVEAEPSLVAA